MKPVNLAQAFASFDEHWRPRTAGFMNGQVIKLVKFQGEFIWHRHDDTDEMFLVHKGSMTVRFRDRDVVLKAGEFFIVPRGMEHITLADEECEAVLFEQAGTLNTGDASDSALTAHEEPGIS